MEAKNNQGQPKAQTKNTEDMQDKHRTCAT
ncbi:hypothetical protein WG66_001318 [Moniliophthora roreri]|nr:hypothetical protein WG66_001318 [Moniliophthora roreri]